MRVIWPRVVAVMKNPMYGSWWTECCIVQAMFKGVCLP